MEFYKEGRVLTIAPSATLDLGEAQYNHKAAIISSFNPFSSNTVQLKFYSNGKKSTAVSFGASGFADDSISANNFTNNLISVRLAEIINNDATYGIRVLLLN